MKSKVILLSLLILVAVLYYTACSFFKNPDTNISEFYKVTNNITLSYDLAYIDDIRSVEDSIYVCGYSYMTNQQYIFSIFDSVTGKINDINIRSSGNGDVSSVYLGKEKFYVGYRSSESTWIGIYDIQTGNEIQKIAVEGDARIVAFFEDEYGSIIVDIRDSFGNGYIRKCSYDYTMTDKIKIYEEISSKNMKISDMIYYDGCYYAVAKENSVSQSKINVFRVSEDGCITYSLYDILTDSDGEYEFSYINSKGNFCVVSKSKTDGLQITVNEIQLSDGMIVNSYYENFSIDSFVESDKISDCCDFIYINSEKAFSYTAIEQKNNEIDIVAEERILLYSSDNENKILLCSNVYRNNENPVIYQYTADGKLKDEFHSETLNLSGEVVKSDVLSGGDVCTLYKDNTNKYSIIWSDFKGNMIKESSVFNDNNISKLNIEAGNNDELYCIGYDKENDSYSVEVYNHDAKKIRSIVGISSEIKEVFSINEKDYILYTNELDETRICMIGNESSDEFYMFSYPELNIDKIFSCSDGSLCYYDADNVYKIKSDDFSSEKILNWSNSGITYKVEAMCILNNGKLVCFTSGNGYTLTILELADGITAEKLRNQKVITVSGVSISSVNFTEAVDIFNSENPEYKVCVNDYLKYNSKNPDECISKLNLDIVSGKIPDVLIGSDSLNLKLYAEKGMFCDLNDFIELDKEISRADFLENIFDCYKTQEKQLYVPINFDIYALVGKKSILGIETGWTQDEFYKIANGKNMFYNSSVSSLCEALIYANLSEYIDWKDKKCNFKEGRFEEIVEYIYNTGIPNDKYESYSEYSSDSTEFKNYYKRFSDNLCCVEFSGISSLSDFASLQNGTMNNEKMVLKGIPSASKIGPLVYSRNTAGINSFSENKEGAWKFIKTLLSDEYQTKITSSASFPVKLSIFDSVIENSCRTGFGYRTDGTFYETVALTEDDVDEFKSVVKSANQTYTYDSRIREIICEILDEYFCGTIKVNEATDKIQNKVSIYLDEIK